MLIDCLSRPLECEFSEGRDHVCFVPCHIPSIGIVLGTQKAFNKY